MNTKRRKYGAIKKGEEAAAGTNEEVFDKFFKTPAPVDAHHEEARTPTAPLTLRPPVSPADANTPPVDAHSVAPPTGLDANAPATNTGGRPPSKDVDARKRDRHAASLVRQHFRITSDLDERFRIFRAKQDLELQEFYQWAGVHLIESVDAHHAGGVDTLASLDDRGSMIMYKTIPLIIDLYLRYNLKNRWRPADDEAARKFNEADLRLVEIGIIQTQFNARFKKINSFKYYVVEIEEAIAAPLDSETVDLMLKLRRAQWQKVQAEGK